MTNTFPHSLAQETLTEYFAGKTKLILCSNFAAAPTVIIVNGLLTIISLSLI